MGKRTGLATTGILRNDPTYNAEVCFEAFPFPYVPGMKPLDDPCVKAIVQAAKELVEQRDHWLRAEGLSAAGRRKAR